MTDQAASQSLAETGDAAGHGLTPHADYVRQEIQTHHGRPASWAVTTIVIIGFVIGGIALPVGPVWWLFWLGTGIVVLAVIIGAAVRIFDDWY